MSLKKTFVLSAGAALLASAFSAQVSAGANEALSACKSVIAADAQLAEYTQVKSRMDGMKRRGRYTHFTLDVKASDANGAESEWTAECKARSSGRVESIDLAKIGGEDASQQVAGANP